jgi:hypothetical protein
MVESPNHSHFIVSYIFFFLQEICLLISTAASYHSFSLSKYLTVSVAWPIDILRKDPMWSRIDSSTELGALRISNHVDIRYFLSCVLMSDDNPHQSNSQKAKRLFSVGPPISLSSRVISSCPNTISNSTGPYSMSD